jgi:hypothetical protein
MAAITPSARTLQTCCDYRDEKITDGKVYLCRIRAYFLAKDKKSHDLKI